MKWPALPFVAEIVVAKGDMFNDIYEKIDGHKWLLPEMVRPYRLDLFPRHFPTVLFLLPSFPLLTKLRDVPFLDLLRLVILPFFLRYLIRSFRFCCW